MSDVSRRQTLKILGAISAMPAATRQLVAAPWFDADQTHHSDWHRCHDRIWLGAAYWANPMEHWRIRDGAAECTVGGGRRNIQLLTHHLTDPSQPWRMSVQVTRVDGVANRDGGDERQSAAANDGDRRDVDGGVGFLVGVRSELDETKSNCFARNGLTIGWRGDNLQIGPAKQAMAKSVPAGPVTLVLDAVPEDGRVELTLTAEDGDGELLGKVTDTVRAQRVSGNVALLSGFDERSSGAEGTRYRFQHWTVGGPAMTVSWESMFGPILWSMYTLHDTRGPEGFVLKLSALTPPMGDADNDTVQLQFSSEDGSWRSVGEAKLDRDAWTATFRVPRWDATKQSPFRLVYLQSYTDGSEQPFEWTGTIKPNPEGRPLRFAALTCQNDYAFPYAPVAENLTRLDADLMYFSGDQIYESHGGFGLIRDPAEDAIVNYLRKFYQFGWAFREPMRHSPTVCIPDDHDVFQGNLWGEGGATMPRTNANTSSMGGYRQPVRMVNAVHRTCVGHHPDPYDPMPAKNNMSVYFGELVYGGVHFAILGDRQFKSGPEHVDTGPGRADHVTDPDFPTEKLDQPGLELLGERQEAFLRHWASDWDGVGVKVLLSQTLLANAATHHGNYNGYLKADLDSGGWPQTPRDRAIDLLRPSKALHVNGDQHLTSLVQYGVRDQRDSNWSFCTPAIAAGYPRWWRPDEVGMPHENRPEHGLANTGSYRDGFGNLIYVYAVGNPEVGKAKNRYERAHEKGSGLGWILIDPQAKTYEIHSFRFLVDVTDGKAENEFPGWPRTIQADENAGKKA